MAAFFRFGDPEVCACQVDPGPDTERRRGRFGVCDSRQMRDGFPHVLVFLQEVRQSKLCGGVGGVVGYRFLKPGEFPVDRDRSLLDLVHSLEKARG